MPTSTQSFLILSKSEGDVGIGPYDNIRMRDRLWRLFLYA